MMPATARKLPSDSVETPDKPWPIVQPNAVIPPTPISAAPARWFTRSSTPPKPSQRKLRLTSATAALPITTPAAAQMPCVSSLLLSLKNSSQSCV